jgi:hypothetical protein
VALPLKFVFQQLWVAVWADNNGWCAWQQVNPVTELAGRRQSGWRCKDIIKLLQQERH